MRREVGSVREMAPGVYRIEVSVGYNTVSGRRRRPNRIVRGSERDAEIALARLLLEAGRLPETEVTVRAFLLDMYLPHLVKRKRRRRTIAGYRSYVEHHIEEPLGDQAVSALVPYSCNAGWTTSRSRGARASWQSAAACTSTTS